MTQGSLIRRGMWGNLSGCEGDPRTKAADFEGVGGAVHKLRFATKAVPLSGRLLPRGLDCNLRRLCWRHSTHLRFCRHTMK